MRKIFKKIITTIAIITLISTTTFANEDNIIGGKDRFETAIEISKNLNTSNTAIIVNSKSTPDMLCSTSLASITNSPILLTNKNKINQDTINELKRLKTGNVYIVGGKDVVSENIDIQLENLNISTQRISGNDRYDTSIKVANIINKTKNIDKAIIIDGKNTLVDAVSIAPFASQKNLPIIITIDDNMQQTKDWINTNNIQSTYLIGKIASQNTNDLPNPTLIYGQDRYETNAKIIEKLYSNNTINKLYYCKGSNIKDNEETYSEDLVDAILTSQLACKEKSPMMIVGKNISKEQRDIISKKKIEELVQVGYGVNEEAKEELKKIQEENNNQEEKPVPPVKPTPPPIEPEIPPTKPDIPLIPLEPPIESKPDIPLIPLEPAKDIKPPQCIKTAIDETKKVISIEFDEKIYTNTQQSIQNGENNQEIKGNIKIGIDKNNIKSKVEEDEESVKYINLTINDKVEINENKLIITLDNPLVGISSKVKILPNSIKDKSNNILKEEVVIENIEGENLKIAFVKEEGHLVQYIENQDNDKYKGVDIIKIENNIKLTLDISKEISKEILVHKNMIIDGSHESGNYKIYSDELKSIKIQKVNNKEEKLNNIDIKNIHLENVNINAIGAYNINLKNLHIDVSTYDRHAIKLRSATVCLENISISSKKEGIQVQSIYVPNVFNEKSTLII